MGRKNVVHQYNMFEGVTPLNMNANLVSNISNVETVDKATIHLTWTAGPAGEFKLFARNGAKPTTNSQNNVKYNDSFYELDFGSLMTITGADSELQIVLNECPFTDIRITYTASSGSATDLKAFLTSKAVGG